MALAQTPDLLVVLVCWVVLAVWATWAVRTRPRIAKSKQAWPDDDKADRKRWRADYTAMLGAFRVRASEWEAEK